MKYYRLNDEADEADVAIVESLVSVGILVAGVDVIEPTGYNQDQWDRLSNNGRVYTLFNSTDDDGEIIPNESVYRNSGLLSSGFEAIHVIVKGTPPGKYYFVPADAGNRRELLDG